MSDPKSFARDLRAFWLALAVICLIGAIAAYLVTRYRLTELEYAATKDARRLAVEVIQPALNPGDGSTPMRGARYQTMLSTIEGRVLVRPIGAVRIWSGNGTMIFADDPELVGDRVPTMRDDIHDLNAGGVSGFVKGGRFHTLVLLRVARSPTSLAADLVRPHAPLLEKAKGGWYPWVGRAIRGAVAFAVLYAITWAGFLLYGGFKHRVAVPRTRAAKEEAKRSAEPEPDDKEPAYMRPGFREVTEARQRFERELMSAHAERDELVRRLQQAELELERSKAPTSAVAEPS